VGADEGKAIRRSRAMPPTLTTMLLLGALALGATGVLARPPFAALTVLWQLRAPAAVGAVCLAALCAGLGHVAEAASLAAGAATVLGRIGVERHRGRARRGSSGPSASLHVLTHSCGLSGSEPRRIAEFIADCGADLVGLQAIGREHALACAELLHRSHPFQVLHATGIDGLGLVSRYRILASELVRLDAAYPYLVADIDAPGGPVHVVVFHPPAALAIAGARHAAVRDLARLAERARSKSPAIMLGDLNSTDASAAWDALVRAGFVDTFRAVGAGAGVTFPVPFRHRGLPLPPLVRIDFVFATPDLAPTRAEVGPPTSSDHLPLFATLARRRAAVTLALDAHRAG
jgi:endonuclease/exonuclease/phosphatase family metal-dependent hydrolase